MSRRVAIVTDSTSDLTPAQQERHGITVVPLNVHFGQETFQDGIDISPDEFIERMARTDRLPTTSQPSVGTFERVFRQLASNHDEICCVLLSSRLSGTVQSATLAAQAVAGQARVEVVDSTNVAAALGMQAIRAADLADEGLDAASIAKTLVSEVGRYHTVFFVETLEHLRRGGRIGKAAQLLGDVMRLRPLLRIEGGQVVPWERTRTRTRATDALVEFARDISRIEQAAVIYNTTPADAEALASQVAGITGEPVEAIKFGPVISTHVGPGVLGVVVKEAASE
jgi:DegV family protein with EDD domain